MAEMRLHKYMSESGICSRRKAEEYIREGLVKVNGEVAIIGTIVNTETDRIEYMDLLIEDKKNLVYYKMNKPRGIVTTCAQYGEQNIIDIIDIRERVFPIGRLDKDTSGLILLTNDGRLANYLMHPRYNHEKEYIVEVFGTIHDKELETLRNGVFLLGSYTKKAKVERISSGKFYITISEGRNRQIRRMLEKVGHRVKKLKRIRIENIELGSLEQGEYKHLSKKEISTLLLKINLE